MNYQEKLALDFKNEDYQLVIDVLKQNIEKGIDPLVASVELIYVHWYIVLAVREYQRFLQLTRSTASCLTGVAAISANASSFDISAETIAAR